MKTLFFLPINPPKSQTFRQTHPIAINLFSTNSFSTNYKITYVNCDEFLNAKRSCGLSL